MFHARCLIVHPVSSKPLKNKFIHPYAPRLGIYKTTNYRDNDSLEKKNEEQNLQLQDRWIDGKLHKHANQKYKKGEVGHCKIRVLSAKVNRINRRQKEKKERVENLK